jgi:hypothetical protein
MKSFRARVTACIASLFALAFLSIPPAFAADIPSERDQDVMIRSTLASFNDANVANNYTVFMAKTSRQLQAQVTPETLQTIFVSFRDKQMFFDDIVTATRVSSEPTKIDEEGVLVLAGVFKTDEMKVTYRLRFVMNARVWKLLGINVNTSNS